MAKIYKFNILKNTRLYLAYSLVFFLLAALAACKKHAEKLSLVWKNDRATGIRITKDMIRDASEKRVAHSVRVLRAGSKNNSGILGDFIMDGDAVIFSPLIPLLPGVKYIVLQDERQIGSITVPSNTNEPAPVLLTIYPQINTLPENQLKLYLHFSKPMRTGQSLAYISLLDKNRDTMRNVFLNLQPELWDTTGTVLTLWLDPGRIKRDLVLNRQLGNPLKKSEHYQLIISSQWKDTRGISLGKPYIKKFIAGNRDSQILDINKWCMKIPAYNTQKPLILDVHEALDHYLLQEAIRVIAADSSMVKGTVEIQNKDSLWLFIPEKSWQAQRYKVQVKARLEDLAGNNLNRVFDRDIRKDKQQNKVWFEREFEVKKQ